MLDDRKCAIIGCGFVGASSAFSLMQSGLFSEMVLIDVNRDRAEGEAMDLGHGLPFAQPMEIYAGSYDDLRDCGLVIIAAGANQKPGESRLDLVRKNVGIFRQIIPEITGRNAETTLLVVSNPVDILTYVTLKLSGFPANRVVGSGTVLDTARLKYLLGRQLRVDSRSVHACIIGEHGDSELAVWSSANIAGVDLRSFCEQSSYCDHPESLRKLAEDVRNSAYKIIRKKGATYYGIAMAVRRIAECILRDEHSILPVSSLVEGHYGLHDLCMGLPAIVGRNGVEKIVDIGLSGEEQAELKKSADTLRRVLDSLELPR
ncbi:MAG TPA: L-lactate dehydrogenase [Ruminococcaceae bacterium]|jgi:L-lactate dehydrogenase|nr:L-lactate dehydrogenase [Oscillospiraceae bacterium]HBQ45613.1 L-lactate dehydrogenase [Oscillospiraceae bacterium]HBT90545.1 L-lactate dehydrogenase [Oscillospiraceae bacterium]HCB91657.1 L-lactate dehydrogenase [Oscillospiraceae bacterium]